MDFMADQFVDGRFFRNIERTGDFNREGLAIETDFSPLREQVVRTLAA